MIEWLSVFQQISDIWKVLASKNAMYLPSGH